MPLHIPVVAAADRLTVIASEELTETEQEIVFDNLDLNTHKLYRLVMAYRNADTVYQVQVRLYMNDDEVAGNYHTRHWYPPSGSTTSFPSALEIVNQNQRAITEVLIMRDPTGYIRFIGMSSDTDYDLRIIGGRKKAAAANLTKIKIAPIRSVPGGLGVGFTAGSKFVLYGYKEE